MGSFASQKHPPPSDLYPCGDISQGGATPTRDEERDEGGETPVLDEPEDDDISPMEHSSSVNKPTNSYLQLQRQNKFTGSSDNSTHQERQNYPNRSDINNDTVTGYDITRPISQYAAELDKARPGAVVYAADVDNSKPVLMYASDAGDGFQMSQDPYRPPEFFRPNEPEYHPNPVASSVAGYHPSPAGASLSSSSSAADVIYHQVDNFQPGLSSDLHPAMTYYPVVMETYANSSFSEAPKPPVYQQAPPDFSVPPPALFNRSLPPPNLPLSSMSVVPPPNMALPSVSLAGPPTALPPPQTATGPQGTCLSFSVPPHPAPGSGGVVVQQPPNMMNSPPPRVVQIAVLPNAVDAPMSLFSPSHIPTSSHLTSTSIYATLLSAPPRRSEHMTSCDVGVDHSSSGSFIATIGGNGDTRRPSVTNPSQPIRSITSSRRQERDYGRGTRRASGSPVGGYSSNKKPVLASLSEDHGRDSVDDNGITDTQQQTDLNNCRTESFGDDDFMDEPEALQIPTLACNTASFRNQTAAYNPAGRRFVNSSVHDRGPRMLHGQHSLPPRGPPGHFQPSTGARQPRWF
jgi:hypothetical protein